jgi:hypothetical protein
MLWARFFKELLKVVHRQSHMVFAVACGLCGVLCGGATHLLIDATAIIDRGLLAAQFVPLLAGLGILLVTLDCGVGRRLPTAAWCRSKPCRLGMVGGDGTPFFSGTLGGTNQCVEGRSGVLLCAQLLVVPTSVPLGSRLDLFHPPSSS